MSFGNILKKLRIEKDLTQDDLAKRIETSRSNIANYENEKNNPSIDILEKISKEFNVSIDYLMGKTTYMNGLDFDKNILKSFSINESIEKILTEWSYFNLEASRIKLIINNFNYYCKYIINQLNLYTKGMYFSEHKTINNFTDPENKKFFLMLHDNLISILLKFDVLLKNNFEITQKDIFLPNNFNAINNTKESELSELINAYILTLNTSYKNSHNSLNAYKISNNFYMAPVYGQISAGQPNWAEECIEGRLPIDPTLMGIVDPEEHYFLKVNGESMNKIVKNGAYALIRRTDFVKNGEIAVVLVNGYDATLKKFTKQGDLIILEPQSTDNSFQTQVYNKDTEIKVIGKYIGKMEINN